MQKAFASPSCKRVGKKERKAIAKYFALHVKTKRETGLFSPPSGNERRLVKMQLHLFISN